MSENNRKRHCIYSGVTIPVKALDAVIIVGAAVIFLIVAYTLFCNHL